jgi:hypothetical protein
MERIKSLTQSSLRCGKKFVLRPMILDKNEASPEKEGQLNENSSIEDAVCQFESNFDTRFCIYAGDSRNPH